MPKMNEGLNLMLSHFSDEELTDEEIEEIEAGLSGEQQQELEKALQTFFDERDELSSRANKAVETVTKLIIALATSEEEEEEEGKKVKKSKPWSFTFEPESED